MVIKVHIPREMHYTYSENGKQEWGQSTVKSFVMTLYCVLS